MFQSGSLGTDSTVKLDTSGESVKLCTERGKHRNNGIPLQSFSVLGLRAQREGELMSPKREGHWQESLPLRRAVILSQPCRRESKGINLPAHSLLSLQTSPALCVVQANWKLESGESISPGYKGHGEGCSVDLKGNHLPSTREKSPRSGRLLPSPKETERMHALINLHALSA